MAGIAPGEGEQDWQATGERRWRITKRVGGYRTVVSEREEVDMNSGENRWVPVPHATERRKAPAGWHRFPKYERMERDDGFAGDVLPWGYTAPPPGGGPNP